MFSIASWHWGTRLPFVDPAQRVSYFSALHKDDHLHTQAFSVARQKLVEIMAKKTQVLMLILSGPQSSM
jgi:hypothetical protein